MKKSLLLILFLFPVLSKVQAQTITGNDVVNLKTFTTVFTDAIKMEKLDDYFKPLGYTFSSMENISRHGLQGHQLTYKGDHSDFKIDLINRLKLKLTYETPLANEYNYILNQVQTNAGYKVIDEANSGLISSTSLADNNYVFVFMAKKTQSGMQYSISASSKVNNLVVNDVSNQ